MSQYGSIFQTLESQNGIGRQQSLRKLVHSGNVTTRASERVPVPYNRYAPYPGFGGQNNKFQDTLFKLVGSSAVLIRERPNSLGIRRPESVPGTSSVFRGIQQMSCLYIFPIEHINEKINRSRASNMPVLVYSPEFYTANSGYKMGCLVKIRPDSDSLGIYVTLKNGDYDDLLPWPMTKDIQVTVVNQIDRAQDNSTSLTPKVNDPAESDRWRKPILGEREFNGIGIGRFISTESLLNLGFICNDKIYIEIKLID